MSHENVEIVRKINDFAGDPDTNLEFIDADAVFDWTASRAPYSGIYRGQVEIRKFWQAFLEAWDEWTVEVQDLIEVDSETNHLRHARPRSRERQRCPHRGSRRRCLVGTRRQDHRREALSEKVRSPRSRGA